MKQEFNATHLADPDAARHLEWLETDGRGGYASSSILDCHTRKYHGLLVAPALELDAKFVFLSKVETSVSVDGQTYDLSTNRYPDTWYPEGYRYQTRFTQDLWPSLTWEVGGVTLQRSILMLPGEHTTLIRYDLSAAPGPVTLRLAPLLACRNMHGLTRRNDALQPEVQIDTAGIILRPYADLPSLYLHGSTPPRFRRDPDWHYNIVFQKEAERGFDHHEDLFRPGYLNLRLEPGQPFVLRASLAPPTAHPLADWDREANRRREVYAALTGDDIQKTLKYAAAPFIITNPRGRRSIVAGYPWFAEWGRDAMIALPGLTLYADRPSEGLAIMKTFMDHRRDGLIPNYLGVDKRGDSYNAVDASLWFFWAAQEYWQVTGDHAGVERDLFTGMGAMLRAFAAGSVPNVRPQENGLLSVGSEHTQLTWMDATVHGHPVTPRHGLAIDLCALWYNALRFYGEVCDGLGKKRDPALDAIADKAEKAIPATFWMPSENHLADVVNDYYMDGCIRPNMAFAVALPYSALSPDQMRGVVDTLTRRLATPYGMRTLSNDHWAYRPTYSGSDVERDGAYHQGTVWPWLIGHYVAARLRVAPTRKERQAAARELRRLFEPLYTTHLRDAGINTISEIMSAEPPHHADGCIAQAWSVAEAIRARHLIQDAIAK